MRIFLNTKGKNDSGISEEMVNFLHYVEHTTDAAAENSGSERIQRIHNRVRKMKTSEEVGVKYMQAWEEKYYEREEGRKEGIEQGIKQGREEGERTGRTKGKEEGILLAKKVFRLAAEGIQAEKIAEECDVTEKQVLEILK